MKKTTIFGLILMALCCLPCTIQAQKKAKKQVNDVTTPLHLLKPDYKVPYIIPTQQEITPLLERVLSFLEAATPVGLVDTKSGLPMTDYSQINADTRLQSGSFRLVSYEWGVTYAGMLAAGNATKNERFTNYTLDRFRFLAATAPYFRQEMKSGASIDGQMSHFLNPQALDDCGAMCAALVKANRSMTETDLRPYMNQYVDYIMRKQSRLRDGTLSRNRPIENSVWLDDLFMSLPALAQMGRFMNDSKYYDEACGQLKLFSEKMFVPEKGLYRHAYVEGMAQHPSFFWGRANGWALMTMVEILDVLPENYYQREDVLRLFRAHVAGLAACQSGDGSWHQLLDREDSYLETSATAIFCYCFAKAINKGWIDAQAYGPATLLAWNAVAQNVSAEGHVMGTCVGTGMGFDPAYYYYRPVNEYAAHGYGPLLLAGAEVINMLNTFHPKMNDSTVQFYTREIEGDAPIFEDVRKTSAPVPGDTRKGKRPVVFTIGDSTVKNGDGTGRNGQWGWGAYLGNYLNPDSASVENYALGGRSSRTFISEGLWAKVLSGLQPGDYVLIQFGHNDGGEPNKGRCRATLKGNGDETQNFLMESTGDSLTVHTYGWYMRQYVKDALDKGAIPIICSLIPRNDWKDGKVIRHDRSYALWAEEAAKASGAYFINLNQLVSDKYDVLGAPFVANLYYGDHTHTSMAGAQLNASIVADALRSLPLPIVNYLK